MIQKIAEIKEDIEAGKEPTATVRELLGWFGCQRRRAGIVDWISTELRDAGLRTHPDFTQIWLDGEIRFTQIPPAPTVYDDVANSGVAQDQGEPSPLEPDATFQSAYLVSRLEAASQSVTAVNLQTSLQEAITLMLAHDFSQLPVLNGERELKGAISWKSIGSRLSQGQNLSLVRDALEPAYDILDSESLFAATRMVIEHGFVFVRATADKRIIGVLTATDLGEQFQTLSEPFLLIGEIENHLRAIVGSSFDLKTIQDACARDGAEVERITSPADLTFGDYIRLLGVDKNWIKVPFKIDRAVFLKMLDDVRKVRNDVMHFDPDGIEERHLKQLKEFANFLERLHRMKAT